MERAKNIMELVNNLDPTYVLTSKDKNVYVPIYEKILIDLRDRILNDLLESQTIFVSGQPRTGKTTALNFLPDNNINAKYDVKYIHGRDLFDPQDINIIDILLMFGYELLKNNDSLEKKYFDKLEKVHKIKDGILKEEKENENEFSIGINAKFFAYFKLEHTYRKKAREIFKLKKPQLLETINEMITAYYEQSDSDKKLLIIIDDLDKLRNLDQIKSIFIEDRFYLTQINCKKIIAIPVSLTTEPDILSSAMDIPQFCLRLSENPIDKTADIKEDETVKKNKSLFREILQKRIETGKRLIENEAIEKAIEYSGGILGQYIQILYNAARIARQYQGEIITEEDVLDGLDTIKKTIERTIISKDKIDLLNTVRLNFKPNVEGDTFVEFLLNNHIIAYSNGATWYEVNPIIKKTVEIYSEKIDE